MKLIIEDDVQEVTVRKVSALVSEILEGTTHLEWYGDLSYIIGAFPDVLERHTKVYGNTWEGDIVLGDGDGDKIIQVRAQYQANTKYNVGELKNVAGEDRFYPKLEGFRTSELVGYRLKCDPPATDSEYLLISFDYDQNDFWFVVDKSITGTITGFDYWFEDNIYLSELIPDAVKLVTAEPVPEERPDSTLDVTRYWEIIRNVWDNLSEEDKGLIEEFWQGMTHSVGNLVQRLYEMDANQALEDFIVFRKKWWALVDAEYKTYKGTGATSRENPDKFYDTTNKPFIALELPEYLDDDTRYLTVNGKSYKIAEVVSTSEVRLEKANFNTAINLDYSIGGQLLEDLTDSNRYSETVTVEKEALLDSELPFNLDLENIFKIEIDTIPDGGRIRSILLPDYLGYTLASEPDRFYINHPIFNKSYKGTWIKIKEVTYRVLDFDPNGYYLKLSGASFPDQSDLKWELSPFDYSEWYNGQYASGSDIFEETSSEEPFYPSDVDTEISIVSGDDHGFYTIKEVINSKKVRLDRKLWMAGATGVTWQIPSDIVVSLTEGLIRRTEHGRVSDCAYYIIKCLVKVEFRVNGGSSLVEMPTLQETVRQPGLTAYDFKELIARDEIYIGHRSILSAELQKKDGVSLTHNVDYTLDSDTGVVTLLGGQLSEGETFFADIYYTPFYGEEEKGYFIRDGWIYFREPPRNFLWAETVFLDHEDPYNKFGQLIDFYQQNSTAYYLAVLGLWTTYWTGPRPDYVERGMNILLGLPFATGDGYVSSISLRRVGSGNRYVISIIYDGTLVEHELPDGLAPIVAPGESVSKFDILSGFVWEYHDVGKSLGRVLEDDSNTPFISRFNGGKLIIQSEPNRGVYKIVEVDSESRIILNGDMEDAENQSYIVALPVVRIFDQTNYPNFIKDFLGRGSLAKYYTQNTTNAEKEIAESILRRHLFLAQARPEAYANSPDIAQIQNFLRSVKPSYTDFIFQTFVELDDSFIMLDDNFWVNWSINLTSTIGWWSALLPEVTDPFSGSTLPHSYESYKDGDSTTGGGIFKDTVNSPFSADDVGRFIWIGGRWRFYTGGVISEDSNVFQSPSSIFTSNDVGKFVYLPNYRNGKTVKIIKYISGTTVHVDYSFTKLSINEEFHVSHETNIGVHEITGFVSSNTVQLASAIDPGTGILYSIIERSFLLDEEAIAIYDEGAIRVYSGYPPIDPPTPGANFIEEIPL